MQHIDFNYHHHKHHKLQTTSKKTLWLSLGFTTAFALIELLGGIFSQSLSLVSDSFHMFSDVAALLLSMVAIHYSAKKPNEKFTYGYSRFEIIAAFLNGLALIIIAIGIAIEGIQRLINPVPIELASMLSIATLGLIVNIVLTLILMRSLKQENNLNIKSALWHFIGDLLNSVGVICAAILIYYTNILAIDAIISLIISLVLCAGGYKICKKAFLILMEAVPENLNVAQIRQSILAIPNVQDIHEFHLWSIAEDSYSLSFHVILQQYQDVNDYEIVKAICEMLKRDYQIEHVTIQIENLAVNEHCDEHLEH